MKEQQQSIIKRARISTNNYLGICRLFEVLGKYNATEHDLRTVYDNSIKGDPLGNKGAELLEEVNSLFIKPAKKKIVVEIPQERVLEITNIFPDIKGGSGKRLRCNLSETSSALLWFRKNYPQYEYETIMQAAELYIRDQEQENYKFCRRLKYFIRKMMQDRSWESDCAEYCEKIKSGDLGNRIENHFVEKIV